MLLLGSILMAPVHGLMAIFEKIKEAVDEEKQHDIERIKSELMALYTKLESGELSEADFEKQEKILLDKLDSLEDEDD
ncbi:gas vesicle protein GvpG [Legionella drancourtii]|uniref:Gas vesicle protein G n=1 Tax=Legionella drancourtii LLAP12 TaxID=658187 RepID=G9ERB8_9GAMM|nr:gas vesicle protein GvpG [Legionella drancourtii]EHL30087.1 hypothetical protein LDG_7830 [Legionella drancourtii LLAP12]